MKKILVILLAVVVMIFVVLLAKDIIIKTSVEKGVEFVTGLKLNIGSLHVGILKPIADIKNLQLFNPSGFPDKTMVDMPEIYVNYDLPAMIGGKMHFPEVRLALKEFVVVKNAQGKLNLDALKSVQAQKKGKSAPQKTSGKAPQIKIDALKLSIGRVIYKDYSKGGAPHVKEFNINLNESYTNVNDPQALASLIVVKALMNTSIAALTNFDLKGLEGTVGGVITGAQKAASAAVSTVKEAGGQVTDTVKGLFKNPFGSEKQTE
jgi:uncharacterized protein involved in outer membrane biogenesis